jgi:CheY-like chemotaxis protein
LDSPPKKIMLIAEDDPAVLTVLKEFFLDRGYDVRTATNGFEALAEIHECLPDILLSDLNMPGMSGFDLLAVVKRRFPSVRLIAMSGTFAGHGMTNGVAAHWVYQKGTGSAALLSAVESPNQ